MGGKGRIDYKEVLSEADFTVFAKLRELRKTFAEKEAVPAYSIFTNEQLAAMVTEKPSSLAELGKINGLGEARVKKYGEAIEPPTMRKKDATMAWTYSVQRHAIP